jgi:hypothetical protein
VGKAVTTFANWRKAQQIVHVVLFFFLTEL